MGLLTDPNTGQSPFIKSMSKYQSFIYILLYLTSIVWLCALPHPNLSNKTYFSENALLPGLVKSEFTDSHSANIYHEELLEEMKEHEDSVPYSWLLAKFKQMGLETYTHNFTLNYPLNDSQVFTGKNVYAILNAPRASSTESLVLSVPYRSPLSIHPPTAVSIAIMLAFAKAASKEKYWSKDLIFLVTEHEQLGIQAWLQAYHGVTQNNKQNFLKFGDLKGRAGVIQAAINLEFHETLIDSIDVKIEGLNGQLPNLDLFNLVSRMCEKEDIVNTFKNKPARLNKNWYNSMKTLLSQVTSQATGVPNGNHGLYFKYGIQAVTLESNSFKKRITNKTNFLSMGRLLEGIFRSLNNLLERFHQSYFFYLLPSPNRFISIGLYIPIICILVAIAYVRSFLQWTVLNENSFLKRTTTTSSPKIKVDEKTIRKYKTMSEDEWKKEFEVATSENDTSSEDEINLAQIGTIFAASHLLGFLGKDSVLWYTRLNLDYTIKFGVYVILASISFIHFLWPTLTPKYSKKSLTFMNILCLLELGTFIICISLYNISAGLLCAVLYIPFAVLINFVSSRKIIWYLQKFLWILLHPFVLLNIVVILYTFFLFPEEHLKEVLFRGFDASQQALVFSILDYYIYENWLYSVISCIFVPIWICLWTILCSDKK